MRCGHGPLRFLLAALVLAVFLIILLRPPPVVEFLFGKTKMTHQSPIDIRSSVARFDPNLGDGDFQFNYVKGDCVSLANTGYSWQVSCATLARSTISASHLSGVYRLAQFHGHWSSNPWNGSEHLILGAGFVGEIHLVHYNTRYDTFQKATQYDDGLAVVAVFLDESPHDNPDLEPLIKEMAPLKRKGDSVSMNTGFDILKLIPGKTDKFWTYKGSLTTPPYTECVVWTVIRNPIPISYNQLKIFRQINSRNVREVQPINDRSVRSSFPLGGHVVPA